MTKVDFLIVGVQKGGTSALDAYLREHSEVCMAVSKEVHFFDTERYFVGQPDYNVYHSHFRPCAGKRVIGEATPIYMYWPGAQVRIRDYNPSMKLIVSLRCPIRRAFSSWNMEVARGFENLSFLDAIAAEETRNKLEWPFRSRRHSYVDRGFYTQQIERLWQYFPRENVHIFKYEDFLADPRLVLDGITDFLGVGKFAEVQRTEVFKIKYGTSMPAIAHDQLVQVFRDEVRALEKLLAWDCSDWLTFPEPGADVGLLEGPQKK